MYFICCCSLDLGTHSARKTLAHLRAKLRKSVPFKRMKLMVVGLQVSAIIFIQRTMHTSATDWHYTLAGFKISQDSCG